MEYLLKNYKKKGINKTLNIENERLLNNNKSCISNDCMTKDNIFINKEFLSLELKYLIRKTRIEKNLSQEQLAKNCNLDKNILSNIENPILKVSYNPIHLDIICRELNIFS
jgi:DNA-binding XRE family transcriptional regulator